MAGWITLHKDITSHWIWEDEFSRGQAWVDLLLWANHKPSSIMIKGKLIKLNRGQQARSEVTLANTWKWSRGRVRRFLELLKNEQMIVQHSVQVTSVITICNYDKYQAKYKDGGTAVDTEVDTARGTPAVQHTVHSEQVNKINNKTKEQEQPFNVTQSVIESVVDGLF